MHRIALLYGGTSSERQVSLKSGHKVAAALGEIGHSVTPIDLQQDSLDGLGIDLAGYTFVFLALHGGWGESGGVQCELERMGLPYSGSDAVASHLAMDKELSKGQFLTHRVPTAPYRVATPENGAAVLARMVREHGFPLAVKPACEGSSLGVSIVRSYDEGEAALAAAFSYGRRVIVERGIVGREFTVGIIGRTVFHPVELRTRRGFFDYEAKYADSSTEYLVKPDIDGVLAKRLRYFGKRAHDALRCHGYSRVDIMVDTRGEIFVLEVNTLPGLTPRSLLPMAAGAAGLSYEETLQAMIDASIEKVPPDRRRNHDLAALSARSKSN